MERVEEEVRLAPLIVLPVFASGCAFHVTEERAPALAPASILIVEDMGTVRVVPDEPGVPETTLESKGRAAGAMLRPGSYVLRFRGWAHAVVVRTGEIVRVRARPWTIGEQVADLVRSVVTLDALNAASIGSAFTR
jgi:hypothetical protein